MSTLTDRIGPIARRAADDDDFKAAVRRAAEAGRSAIFKPAPPPTRLRRVGTTIKEAGAVLSLAGRDAEKQRRAEQRATQLRALAIGGGGAAAAAAGATLYRRQARKAPDAEPVVVVPQPVTSAA